MTANKMVVRQTWVVGTKQVTMTATGTNKTKKSVVSETILLGLQFQEGIFPIFYFYKHEMIQPNTEIITLIFITSCGQCLWLLSTHLS
jgi:hypothetical protein